MNLRYQDPVSIVNTSKMRLSPKAFSFITGNVWVSPPDLPTTTRPISSEIEDFVISLFNSFDEVKMISPLHKHDFHEFCIFYEKEGKQNKRGELEKYFRLEIKIMNVFKSHLFDFHYLPYVSGKTDYLNFPQNREIVYTGA